ncbi:G domain-containing protein [Fusarium keratoplasticum]|uniref:G domain-containing protein n=1 Tax=Fusarium keratoplasticum TaxID=1328300 RepID=A0ACC0QFE2_9HYPO|nr:G domain-containing protein [Fusarium keratoplasticum]KAI8652521.1 G domain-containing protein [Fusarium keratoplasticum]KAI8653250.1 G domain-containing protein [Fusarium keratoplasticum]
MVTVTLQQPAGLQADRASKEENAKSLSLIAVMGVTGSGKSNFLQHLIGKGREKGPTVGHSLSSCRSFTSSWRRETYNASGTQKTEIYECRLGNKQVVFFDTPGFDDTYRGDADVLADVAQVLSSSYKNNLKLNGIIYLHRIKDERMTNAIMRNLTMFRNLCGDAAFQNVALVTTFWDELQDQSKGEDREEQLLARSEWWGYMTAKGSKSMRFHNTRESALDIVSKVIDLDIVTLQVQEEMVNRGLEVDQTTAGEALKSELAEQRKAFEKALQTLHHEKEQAKRDHDVLLQQMIETMELEKATLLQEIESEQAALHADRREERRRIEQEFYDEKLRLERMVQEVAAESVRIKEETETEAREERRRLKAEFDGKLHEFSEQQSQEVQKIVREFEQRLAAEKEDGQRRLSEALERSDAVIRDLRNSMNRSRSEDRRKYEEEIKNIKRRQRETKEQSERWADDMERINREILASQVEQRDADKKDQGGIKTKIDKLKEQKKSKTQVFWSRIGALAGVGSLLLAALA